MSEHRRRQSRSLTAEQVTERFTADGPAETFEDALRLVLAGGPDDAHGGPADVERKADK